MKLGMAITTRRLIMKSKRYSVEQIVSAIKQQEAGLSVTEVSRKMGVVEGTFLRMEKEACRP